MPLSPYGAYDANGNILTMTQKGLKLNNSPLIDSLRYGYNATSNKLSYVTDLANDANSKMGDFKKINNNTRINRKHKEYLNNEEL